MVDSEVVTDKNAEVYMIEPVVDSEAVTDRNAEVYMIHQFWASPRGLGELGRRVIYFGGGGGQGKMPNILEELESSFWELGRLTLFSGSKAPPQPSETTVFNRHQNTKN